METLTIDSLERCFGQADWPELLDITGCQPVITTGEPEYRITDIRNLLDMMIEAAVEQSEEAVAV